MQLIKNILKAEQLGFVAGNRTSDAHIILHTLIYVLKRVEIYLHVLEILKKLSKVYLGNNFLKNF